MRTFIRSKKNRSSRSKSAIWLRIRIILFLRNSILSSKIHYFWKIFGKLINVSRKDVYQHAKNVIVFCSIYSYWAKLVSPFKSQTSHVKDRLALSINLELQIGFMPFIIFSNFCNFVCSSYALSENYGIWKKDNHLTVVSFS